MVWRRIFIWIKIVLMLTLWQEGKKQNTSQKTKHWIPLTKHALQLGGTGSLMKKGVALVPQKPSTSTPFTQRRTLAYVHMHPHPFKLKTTLVCAHILHMLSDVSRKWVSDEDMFVEGSKKQLCIFSHFADSVFAFFHTFTSCQTFEPTA